MFGVDLSFGLIEKLKYFATKFFFIQPPNDHVAAATLFALIMWLTKVFLRKYLLLLTFSYTFWIYELGSGDKSSKISFKTKLWMISLKVLSGKRPRLFSYQNVLPRLPLPKIKDTISRYLQSMRPLMNDCEFEKLQKMATNFQNKQASRLQKYLWLKSLWTANYVSDWWEKYVYLTSRSPLMVNSNFYGMDACYFHPTQVQAARAGYYVHHLAVYLVNQFCEKQAPILLNDIVPLCSAQYERQFCTTRIPQLNCDKLVHYTSTPSHIAVYCNGHWYKCDLSIKTHETNYVLKPYEFQKMFESIISESTINTTLTPEAQIAALTAGARDHWALTRSHYFSSGINQKSLSIIEQSAFVVILDMQELGDSPNDPEKYSSYAKSLMHGKCYDRWFDKSFNLIIFKNGKMGVNVEHSWADAPVSAQMIETILATEFSSINHGYSPDGNCIGYPPSVSPMAQELKWDLPPQCIQAIESSLSIARPLADDIDLYVAKFSDFGKGFIKSSKVSPDAFIQLALQLTFFRVHKEFCLTYEASMTRLFRLGRTETVRSCTSESCSWVRAMIQSENDSFSISGDSISKIELFRYAAARHQQLYRESMTGRGVDRHLFCLYVISKYLGGASQDNEFLSYVINQPWRLSTSQTPHTQVGLVDVNVHPDFENSGGGFGPVSDNGYGVNYMISGEKSIWFHVSSKFSCENTSSSVFLNEIFRSLRDIKKMINPK